MSLTVVSHARIKMGYYCSLSSVSVGGRVPHLRPDQHTHTLLLDVSYMALLPRSAPLPPTVRLPLFPLCFINHLSSPAALSKAGPIRPL